MAPRKAHAFSVWLALAASGLPLWAQLPLGAEFQVNSYTPQRQRYPSVATEVDGDFVVVWHRAGSGDVPDVFFRRFDSAGTALAVADFALNEFTLGSQNGATVDVAADGTFVVAWTSFAQDSADTDGVFARLLDAAGQPVAGEFQVNTITERSDYDPALAMDADGDFVVVWSGYDDTGSRVDIFGQRFDAMGDKIGGEFQMNSGDYDFGPAIGMDGSGGFVVVWSGYLGASTTSDILGHRFDSAGMSIGGEFLINSITTEQQARPDVAVGLDGSFMVAWSSLDETSGSYEVIAQRFSSAGARVGAEFRVNTYTPNRQDDPMVDVDSDGDFVVTWSSVGQDAPPTTSAGVFGRRFDSAGAALAVEFQVNSYTTDHQRHPAIAVAPEGDFVVSWESLGQDGASEGIFAQRFSQEIPLDADGNGLFELPDGLVILRHLFGFTGANLVTGPLGDGCSRCDGPAVQTYLTGLGLTLDIDGNTLLEPLADGVLVLRHFFDFTGPALVNGAVGAGCSRCDAETIEPYLESID